MRSPKPDLRLLKTLSSKKVQWFTKDNSDRHIRDILGVLQVQQTQIDVSCIETWLDELGVRDVWKAIQDRQCRPNPTYE